jgi:predicted nucleic acid-binding Zn ribbon protein
VTNKPCCFVCGKEIPRYSLDKHGTCGAELCIAWAKKRDREMRIDALSVGGILAAVLGVLWYLAERYLW